MRRGMKRRLREPVSGPTHLVGGLLALVALFVLLTKAAGRVDQLVAFGIFGLSLVALYGASALYHLLPVCPPATARLRRLDHMTIFILIAGTYTPICLLALWGGSPCSPPPQSSGRYPQAGLPGSSAAASSTAPAL